MYIEKTVIYPQTYHQSQNRQEVQIDLLVKEQEAILDINSSENITVLKCNAPKSRTKSLPPIELLAFDKNPSCWLKFIKNLYIMVHLKKIFNDTIHIERLLGMLRSDAKGSVEPIRKNGIFYANTLKCLSQELGNPNVVTHLKLKSLFD